MIMIIKTICHMGCTSTHGDDILFLLFRWCKRCCQRDVICEGCYRRSIVRHLKIQRLHGRLRNWPFNFPNVDRDDLGEDILVQWWPDMSESMGDFLGMGICSLRESGSLESPKLVAAMIFEVKPSQIRQHEPRDVRYRYQTTRNMDNLPASMGNMMQLST